MTEFLQEFDDAIRAAQIHKTTGKVWKLEECPEGGQYPVAKIVARTMHSAFMAAPVPKFDPKRDQ
jgi:hypothetical protein